MSAKPVIITSVVAHIDHGKTTLIDSLIAHQGVISNVSAGNLRYLDTRNDEQSRGITLKLSAITLKYNHKHVIIDTPGHVDFEALVQKSSHLSDSFLIIIDANEGITPRTYSLVNFTKDKDRILVINKIDKLLYQSEASLFETIASIIYKINSLIKEDVFDWEHNNVILACSTMCYGINTETFKKIAKGNKSSLKNAIKFLILINEKILKNDTEKIRKTFNIKKNNPKSILSSVMPLAESVFNSLESTHTFKPEKPHMLGISTYSILKKPKIYELNNLLFVTRMFCGKLKVNDEFFCIKNNEIKKSVIKNLYTFGINELISVPEIEGSNLVCIDADMLKDTYISDTLEDIGLPQIELSIQPFYRTKIILNDVDQLEEMKMAIKTLSHTETILKVKLNRFNELEVMCAGKVQFEKIMTDLNDLGFNYSVSEFNDLFCESVTEECTEVFHNSNYTCKIQISREESLDFDRRNSLFCLENQFQMIIRSVHDYFINSGPLIEEKIIDTKIRIELEEIKSNSSENITDVENDTILYNFIKKSLTDVYMKCSPTIVPFYYRCTLHVSQEFLGAAYTTLQKHEFFMKDELFDELTGFFIVTCGVPQFNYNNFIDEIRLKTKGTVYISSRDEGYVYIKGRSYNNQIVSIRKYKGLFTGEKIVVDPEKQRTLKR